MKGELYRKVMSKRSENYSGIYSEIVEILGEEAALKIYETFKGQQVTFPMRFYSKKYIEEYLINHYNGRNLKQLSKKLGYTCNWLQQLINKLTIKNNLKNMEE